MLHDPRRSLELFSQACAAKAARQEAMARALFSQWLEGAGPNWHMQVLKSATPEFLALSLNAKTHSEFLQAATRLEKSDLDKIELLAGNDFFRPLLAASPAETAPMLASFLTRQGSLSCQEWVLDLERDDLVKPQLDAFLALVRERQDHAEICDRIARLAVGLAAESNMMPSSVELLFPMSQLRAILVLSRAGFKGREALCRWTAIDSRFKIHAISHHQYRRLLSALPEIPRLLRMSNDELIDILKHALR